ncbi:hypothetical protein EYC84_007039 [Monilinia fructicola]|uniref:Uncharacterized protein n=1 Tax=Monilinia fructicola TaxID=38448 RepID=A0A5M9K5B7_MONFR|nr:hypothetical protein EYC84_007039 [Monilinia fructicola]
MEAEEKQAHKRGIKKERKKGRRKHRDHGDGRCGDWSSEGTEQTSPRERGLRSNPNEIMPPLKYNNLVHVMTSHLSSPYISPVVNRGPSKSKANAANTTERT